MSRRNSSSHYVVSKLLSENDLDDAQVSGLLAVASQTTNDALQEQAYQGLAQLLLQKRTQPFTNGLEASEDNGSIFLGDASGGRRYTLEEDMLSKHLLAVGQSGAGKTSLFFSLISQLEVPFWSFDLKRDYRHLARDQDDLLVLPWTELRFNPLVPPKGVPPRRWAQVLSEIFGHATSLLSGSKNYLLKSIIEPYQVYDLFEEVSPPYPSLHELEDVLASAKINYVRKTSNYRDTVLNRVEAMNLGAGTIFDCSQGYPLEELLEQDVVFEFDGVSRDVQNFLMEILLAAVYEYRLAQTQRDEGLNHVFVLDEGKQVFSVYKERQDAAGIPAIDELTAKMREFGEGLLVGDQEASKLTDSIKANTYTKVLLPTGDHKQFTVMAESMDLTERQRTKAQQLGVGEAIIQTGNHDPLRVSTPKYGIEKEVTDTELRKLQGSKWAELSSTPRQRPPGFEDMLADGTNGARSEKEVIDDPAPELYLSTEAEQLLEDIVERPFVPLTQRYSGFSSQHKGFDAKAELVEKGIVVEKMVQTGPDSRKLLELTDQGQGYVTANLELDPSQKGRGGIVHRYWQRRVKEVFDGAGWTTKLELFDADVYVNTGEIEIAVEVAMENTERELQHVEKHLESGFDSIWVVCRDYDVKQGLEARLTDSDIDDERIAFREFDEIENMH